MKPSLPWLKEMTPAILSDAKITGEFTFRLGPLIPLVVLIAGLLYGFRKRKVSHRPWVLPLALAGVIAWSLALRPNNLLSLAPFTMTYFPMFRVGARALLFLDIALVAAFVVILDQLWQSYRGPLIRSMIALLALIAVADAVGGSRFLRPLPTFVHPEDPVYQALREQPSGWLLHLPVPHQSESTFVYQFHRQPSVDGLPGIDIREPTSQAREFLRQKKVRYLVLRKGQGIDEEPWRRRFKTSRSLPSGRP